MSKKTNKTAMTLLSGVVIGGCVVAPVTSYANSNDNSLAINMAENTLTRSTTVIKGTLTESVYLRASASWSAQKGIIIKKGETVDIIEKGSLWSKVKSGNHTGYIANEHLKITTSSSDTSTTVKYTGVVNADYLNVRSGGSVDYSSIGGLSKGTKIEIVTKLSNGWFKIKYKTGYGYVNGKYVTNVAAVDNSNNSSNSSNTSTSTTVKYTGVVNADYLNVRSGGSVDYSSIGGLSKGTKIEIVTKLSNGWFKIKYKTGYGYVNGKYVTNVAAVDNSNNSSNTSTSTAVKYTGTVNASSLNVRKGGSTNYDIIGKLSNGTKVEIVDKMSNGWSKIKYGTGYGYVNTSYLSNIKSVSSSDTTTVIKTGIVNTASLNVRKGSSTSYDIIGKLSKGAKVEIVSVASNGWYKIKYGTGYGYVSNSYIDVTGSTTGQRTNLNNFLFVGDSFTALLKNTIEAKNSNVYVHAKSGSMPSYWLDKVSSMPSNSKVDGVVLLIGVNGAGYESNKRDVKTLINKLSAKYPNKTIYVQKIFPVGRNFTGANPYSFNQKIASLNSVIESHCKTVSNAKFINTTSGFVDSNGYLIHTYDGLHISSSYNNQFYNNILNAVKNAEK